MKVDGSLKSLLQGVSQQPARDRLAGQCTEMLNMSADPVSGLARRAPTDLVGALGASDNVRGFHNFETRDGNKFLACFYESTVRVFDYNAVEYTVEFETGATAYLAGTSKLVFGTVLNEVVVVNRGTIPAMLDNLMQYANRGPVETPMGIVSVLGGAYGREYKVYKDGALIGYYKTPYGSESSHIEYVRTSHIATRLYQSMTMTGATASPDGTGSSIQYFGALAGADWTVTQFNNYILIKRNNSTIFNMTSTDDSAGTNLKAATDNVPQTSDLPRFAPHGYLMRVATETDPEEDVYLQFIVEGWEETGVVGTGFGRTGYWQEAVSSTTQYGIDLTKMPHVLEWRNETNDFLFRKGLWADRTVGTDTSNPPPSFIGVAINDVATFQGRLVFLSGSYVCMSRTNHHTDFWMASASQLLDTDPIDISSTAVEASTMLAAVPHNRDVVVFSARGQFVLYGRSVITPANATLMLTTAFEAELSAKPVPAGRNVFFATNYGRFTGIREFYTESIADINDTRAITQHVKEFIQGKVSRLAASSNYDTLLVQTVESRNTVWVYQYIWSDQDKIQSAWSKWTLPLESIYSFFDESVIYFVVRTGSKYFLYRMPLDIYDDIDVGYAVHLDSRFDVPDVYTAFVLPYDHLQEHKLTVIQGTNCPNPGMVVPIDTITWDAVNNYWVVTLRYNMQGGDVVAGIPYLSVYRPTMPFVKDQYGVVIGTGKLVIKHFIISLNNTGHIIGQLLSKYGDGEEIEFQGRILAAPENLIGKPALTSDSFYVPFRDDVNSSDFKVYTDRHLPMTLLDIEWVGQWQKRGQRMNTGDQ